MSKTDNIYIKRARKKRLIKKLIFLGIMFICAVLYIVFFTNTFIIKKIKCTGENLLTKDYVIDKTNKIKGDNIFTISKDDIEKSLKENPYIQEVEIIRSFPKSLVIKIKEATGLFYIKDSNYIVSSKMVLLEQVKEITNKELIEIRGLDVSNCEIGDKISNDKRIEKILIELYDEQGIIKDNKEDFSITAIELGDLSQINVYLNNIKVQIGSDENIRKKMSDAINIYKSNLAKEYINVSFDGTPDFK